MSDLDARIDLALTDGTWTPIPDVVGSAGVTLAYGIRGTGPLARTAAPARLTFALHNDAGNAVGVQGAYAPGHAHVRAGFGVGTPVRLVLTRARHRVRQVSGAAHGHPARPWPGPPADHVRGRRLARDGRHDPGARPRAGGPTR